MLVMAAAKRGPREVYTTYSEDCGRELKVGEGCMM